MEESPKGEKPLMIISSKNAAKVKPKARAE